MKFLVHRQSEIMTAEKISLWNYFWKCHWCFVHLNKTQLLEASPSTYLQNATSGAFCNQGEEKSSVRKNKMKLSLWILWNFVTFFKYIKPVTVCNDKFYRQENKRDMVWQEVAENIEKFLYSREPFKPLFSCVATKCKIFFSLACVKSGGKWITIHTRGSYFHCLSDWSGVGFILTMVTLFPLAYT